MSNTLLAEEVEQAAPSSGLLTYLPAILWQRRWWIIVPTLLGLMASLGAALLIPAVYQASAVMLVRAPHVDLELIARVYSVFGDGH